MRRGFLELLFAMLLLVTPRLAEAAVFPLFSAAELIEAMVVDFEGVSTPFDSIPLNNQFASQGVVFINDTAINQGWSVSLRPAQFYRPNSFLSIDFSSPALPGRPYGVSGTKVKFVDPVTAFGFDIQNGFGDFGPLNPNLFGTPQTTDGEYQMTVRALDVNDHLLGEYVFDFTHPFLGTFNGTDFYQNQLFFLGLRSSGNLIAGAELIYEPIIKAPGNTFGEGYSLDNLAFSHASQTVVPEPSAAFLFLLGSGAVISRRRRQFRVSRKEQEASL